MAEAVPPVAVVAPPPGPQAARTYADFYQSDPFQGQYAGPYNALRVTPGDDRPTPAQIRQALVDHPDDKLAFVMMADDGRTVLLHRIRQYHDPFGADPTDQNGAILAVKGEAHAMGVNIVSLPENAFTLTEGLAPTTQAVMEALGDAEPGADWLMGPFAAGAEGVEATTVRRLMLVPNRFLGPLLAERLTARQLWERVLQPLMGDNLEADCALFVAWARRAIVAAGEGAVAAQSIRMPMPTTVELGGRVAEHVANRLLRDLPARDPAWHGGGNVAGLMAAGFGQMTSALDRQTASAEQRRQAQKAEEQSVAGRWGSIGRLLRICRVDTEDQLPSVYRIAARAGKKVDRITLQDELALRVAADGTSLRYPFVRTQLATSFSELKFRASFPGSRDTGMSIYHFCLGGDNQAARMNTVAQQYDQALAGPGVTVDQLQAVAGRMGDRTPTSANILLDAYEDYAALLDVILGEGHEVAQHFRSFLFEMRNLRAVLDDRFAHDDLAGQWLTREIHVQMDHWFAQQELSEAPYPKPELGDLVQMVRFDRAHNERRAANTGGARRPPAAGPQGGGRGGGGGGGPPPGGSPTSAPREDNPHPCPTGLVRWDRWSAQRFRAQHPNTPQNDTGVPFCLSYHKRGTCYENCGRRGDHRAHNPQETARLLAHLGPEALVAPPPPEAAP